MLHVYINEKSKTRENIPCIGCMFPPSRMEVDPIHMKKKIKQILGMAKTTDPRVPNATLMGRVLLNA